MYKYKCFLSYLETQNKLTNVKNCQPSSEPLADFSGNNSGGAPVSNSCKLSRKQKSFLNSDLGCGLRLPLQRLCWQDALYRSSSGALAVRAIEIYCTFCILTFCTLCISLFWILAFCTLCNFCILYYCILHTLQLLYFVFLHFALFAFFFLVDTSGEFALDTV